MSLPAHEATSAAPSRSNGHLGRVARLGLIGLAIVPFIMADHFGLVAATTSVTVQTTADSQILSSLHGTNFGGSSQLRTVNRPTLRQRTLIRFNIPSGKDKIVSAQLRLFVREPSNNGGDVHLVVGKWTESSVTWDTAPKMDPAIIGRIGPTGRPGRSVTVRLALGSIRPGKQLDIELVGVSANGAIFHSRETGKGPQLILGLAAAPAPNAKATATPKSQPTPTPTDGAAGPTPTPTDGATPTPTPTPTDGGTPTPTPTAPPAPTPTSTPAPTPAPTAGSTGPSGPTVGILVSKSELAALPMSGSGWTNLKSWADASAGTPDIQNQDEDNDIHVLAKALVYARTGAASYRVDVLANLKAAVGSEAGGRTLAAARNLPGYVIAADLIDLGSYDPSFDSGTFRPWLRRLLTEDLSGDTLISTHETRPNNWGTHAGAARAAIARYLGDSAQLARTAQVFHGWLGDRTAYTGFSFGDTSWQCDPTKPVGIDPKGCSKSGHVLDGALPDDMRRGASFQWPPTFTDYPWEAMQGATLQALILDRAGYDAFGWEDRAIERAANFLYDRAGWPATGDDTWQPWLLNMAYGTSRPADSPAHAGKNMSFTDWLYGH